MFKNKKKIEVSNLVSTLAKPVEDLPDSHMLLTSPTMLNTVLSKVFFCGFFKKVLLPASSINLNYFSPFVE